MSQIAGILHLDGAAISAEEAQLQLAPLSRAPHDRLSAWRGGPITLAHLALDIAIGDAQDRQPITAGGYTLVWDGRLFNRSELHGSLAGVRDLPPERLPDSRLVLESWLRWGKECLTRLIGDFAFAVWIATDRHLFVARDRMGMRPVYYTRTARLFAFASQIKGLRDLPGVDRNLDEEWVADYLSLTHLNRENTVYLGVRRLPAAHWMSVAMDGKVRIERYWRLRDEPVVKFKQDEEYYDHVRTVTMRAVHDRMPGRGPVASMLSGGLDSSTVTAFACQKARVEGRRVVAVSSVLPEDHPGPETDERQYVRAFLERYPECEWIPVTAPGKHFLSDLERLLEICDQPVRDAFHYMTYAVGDAAQGAGARILLTGLGGDFFISSRVQEAFARLLMQLKWHRLRIAYLQAKRATPELSLRRFVRSELLRPLILDTPLARWLQAFGLFAPAQPARTVASEDLASRFDLPSRERRMARNFAHHPLRAFAVTDEHIASSGVVAHVLEYYAVLGLRFGMQVEHPLLDHRVVSAVANLPTELRRRGDQARSVVRMISSDSVPDVIRLRDRKEPFSPDVTRRYRSARVDLSILRSRALGNARWQSERLIDWDVVAEADLNMRSEATGWNQDARGISAIFTTTSVLNFLRSKAPG